MKADERRMLGKKWEPQMRRPFLSVKHKYNEKIISLIIIILSPCMGTAIKRWPVKY